MSQKRDMGHPDRGGRRLGVHGVEAGLEIGFYLGPVFADDAEPDAVARGVVGHEVVVAEGSFVLGADGLHGVLGLQVFVVGLEGYAV